MENHLRLSFRKGDLLVIAAVAVAALAMTVVFRPRTMQKNGTVQIYQNNKLIKECALQEAETFVVGGDYHNTIVIEAGKVAITESDCPGEDCVHSGWINSGGRSIVCLPNKVEIRIVGESEVDFVVR